MKLLKYKGYIGDIQVSIEEAVDDYLKTCQEKDYQPEVPCKGSFNIRIGHDLHLAAMVKAKEMEISLNEFVTESISNRL